MHQTVHGLPLRGPTFTRERGGGNEGTLEESEDEVITDETEDEEVRARNLAYDAFGRADSLEREAYAEEGVPHMGADGDEDHLQENEVEFQNTMSECMEPLYVGSRETRMQSGIVLMTLSTVFGVSDTFLSALLTYLAGTLLPRQNLLPRTAYELKRMIMRIGLDHQRIDSCPNGHILFEGEVNGTLTECPRCQHPRFISETSKVPHAVTRYFPIISKVLRLYRCPSIAELLRHFNGHTGDSPVMTSIADSHQWKEVSRMYPLFRDYESSLRMGLIADGVCPHGNQNSRHSTWIILLAIYNFPGWLVTKKFFLNLSILIPGPKAPTSDTIDVFLKPLVRELLQLWDGVPALNMSKPVGCRSFTLRGMLLWSIHDFPAFGLIAGQTVKGYVACPICGENTCAEHSIHLKKMCYLGHRRFLPLGHRFRRARAAFNNSQELGVVPPRRTGEQLIEQGRARSAWLRNGGTEDSPDDPVKTHGVKRASILYALPYWKVSHTIPCHFLNYLTDACLHSRKRC